MINDEINETLIKNQEFNSIRLNGETFGEELYIAENEAWKHNLPFSFNNLSKNNLLNLQKYYKKISNYI